jgi:catechol 2,3-dioxygenase-like lactoylglutathione lyase family enzyme
MEELMSATATAVAARLQVSLNVSDLEKSLRFYRALLGIEPGLNAAHQLRFELADPPVILCLTTVGAVSAGSINHVGLRMPDSATLVEVQRRLEEAGIATQRQEGVECCYARQTKFWVTDPDRNLWELYVLEDDIDHSGFEDAPPQAPKPAAVVWTHLLTRPVPQRIPHADASVDEVRLEGSFNARREDLRLAAFLPEVFRVLRPGGKVVAHCLVGDRALESPALPGLAALVQRVPAANEPVDALREAGFGGMVFEKLDVTCLQTAGTELREMRLVGWRPGDGPAAGRRRVLYKGPLAQVTDEEGTVFPRGVAVSVSARAWQLLNEGPAAGQFLFFPLSDG